MAASLLTAKQRSKIANLMASHRGVEGCADYEDSPTMLEMFKYVNRLIQAERRWQKTLAGKALLRPIK